MELTWLFTTGLTQILSDHFSKLSHNHSRLGLEYVLNSVLSVNPGAGDWPVVENFFLLFLRPLSPTDYLRLTKNGMAENSSIHFGYQRFLILISQLPIEVSYSWTMDMKNLFQSQKAFFLDTYDWHFLLFDFSCAHNFYLLLSLSSWLVGVVRNCMSLQLSKQWVRIWIGQNNEN